MHAFSCRCSQCTSGSRPMFHRSGSGFEPGASGAGPFEIGTFETEAFETEAFETEAFESEAFEAGPFETEAYEQEAFEAGGKPAARAGAEPAVGSSHAASSSGRWVRRGRVIVVVGA
jgi:hypothetical protein